MKTLTVSLLAASGLWLGLTQCASDPAGSSETKSVAVDRRVSLPEHLGDPETEALPAVVALLKEAGFKPVQEAGCPYRLDFHADSSAGKTPETEPASVEGPAAGRQQLSFAIPGGQVFAAAALNLYQGSRVVASAAGAFQGNGNRHDPGEALHYALERCLAEFSDHLAAADEMHVNHSPGPAPANPAY